MKCGRVVRSLCGWKLRMGEGFREEGLTGILLWGFSCCAEGIESKEEKKRGFHRRFPLEFSCCVEGV